MKRAFFSLLLLTLLLSACTPPQQILSTWVNREALPKEPYKSIYILTLAQNVGAKVTVESGLAEIIQKRGGKAVRSSDVIIPKFSSENDGSREQLAKVIKDAGCDAVLTVALLDVKSEDRYQPGTTYYPVTHEYYGSYYRYVGYYYEEVSEGGYYITDKTYYIETNFYDLASDQLLWSVQSDAYNPSSLDDLFKGYSRILMKQLEKEGLLRR